MDMGHQAGTQRNAVLFVILRHEFGLDLGHIHTAGTFGLARLTTDAEIHHFLDFI